MKKYILSIVFLSQISLLSFAQQKAPAFPEKKLVVQLLTSDQDILDMLNKTEKKKPGKVARYQKFIADYNEHIQSAVKKFWGMNKQVEFVEGESKQIISKNASSYIITFTQVAGSYFDPKQGYEMVMNGPHIYGLSLKIPGGKSYGFPFPLGFRFMDTVTQRDMIFTVESLQLLVKYNLSHKSLMYPVGYAEFAAKDNCSFQSRKTLLADPALLDEKISNEKLKEAYQYGARISSGNEIDESVNQADSLKAYLLIVPYQFDTRDAGGNTVNQKLLTFKVIAAAGDGSILNFQRNTFEVLNTSETITAKDLTNLSKCKSK